VNLGRVDLLPHDSKYQPATAASGWNAGSKMASGRLQCLPWELATGLRWAILPDLRASGESMPVKDSLIAATALLHGLTIATRNTRDFSKARVKIVDPFAEGEIRSC
jgi:hypothetical protein